MKAITVEPGRSGTARFEDFPDPDVHEGSVLVEAVAAVPRIVAPKIDVVSSRTK